MIYKFTNKAKKVIEIANKLGIEAKSHLRQEPKKY